MDSVTLFTEDYKISLSSVLILSRNYNNYIEQQLIRPMNKWRIILRRIRHFSINTTNHKATMVIGEINSKILAGTEVEQQPTLTNTFCKLRSKREFESLQILTIQFILIKRWFRNVIISVKPHSCISVPSDSDSFRLKLRLRLRRIKKKSMRLNSTKGEDIRRQKQRLTVEHSREM